VSLQTGARIGPYEVVAPIGAGGMGEVYRARDTKLSRDVALKVLPASVAADRDRLSRFQREAQVLASLNHPNIAAIYGIEDSGSTHALIMELVPGRTLAEIIGDARHPAPAALKIDDVLPLARQIAEALEYAHESGIIHRDLKPANIKVRDDGTVKVLDFGLAKALSGDASRAPDASAADAMNSPTLTARATELGMILGTAAYMAPEQAKGRAVDRRADIWAFGVVLFEMLTGRRGYHGEDVSETLAAVLTREVDWTALPADTPPRLRMLLRDCLARDPKQRLRDIGEARRVLDQLIAGDAGSVAGDVPVSASAIADATPPSRVPVWRRALPWTIAALAIVAAVVMSSGWFSKTTESPRPVTRARYSMKELAGFVALSHDGTKLAYTVSGPQGLSLWLRQMNQFEGKPLPGTEVSGFPLFSPDGEWVAFSTVAAPTKVKKVPIAGGTSITLCDGSFANGGADWGPDDTIVFAGSKGLTRVSANGGTPQTITTIDTGKGETFHSRPQFLPGGRYLLFTLASAAGESPQFAVLDLKNGGYRAIAKGGDNGRYAPTGHLTFVREGTLFAVPFDLDKLTVTGPEVPVAEGVSTVGPAGTGDYSFSDTGLLVYSEAQTAQGTLLMWMDRQGKPQPIPGQVRRQWATGRLSPDGQRIANGIRNGKDNDIWVLDLARGTPTRLSFGGQNDFPIWTPDGKRVVYGGTKDGKPGIYSVPADGSSQPELVIPTDPPGSPTSFAPDGKTLLYSQIGPNGRMRILVLPLPAPGSQPAPHPLRDGPASDGEAQVSPNGQWVAFSSTETGTREVYVLPFSGPGAKVRISNESGQWPRWSHRGDELFYWTATQGSATLNVVTITNSPGFVPSAPRVLFRGPAGTTWDVTPSPDRFLVESISGNDSGSVLASVTDWFEELRRRAPAKK